MKVPLLDLAEQYRSIRSEIDPVVAEVFESQRFVLGAKVTECEEAIAEYAGCKRAVGVSSGTDALLIALMAEDVGPGQEVITTPYTFFATAGSIARVGARPVFVDIDPVSYNIDPALVEEKISKRTKAIMPVHLFGRMADMDPIMEIAARHGLPVIEDAAQAIGAESDGRRSGSIGHYGCFSFFPAKNLGGAGDGGMVVTNDEELAERLVCLRTHGEHKRYHHRLVGGNFRLDALQAAVLRVKLGHLDAWTEARRSNAARYGRLFAEASLLDDGRVRLPDAGQGRHVFNQYVVRVERRDELRDHLTDKGIGTGVYYPVPLHLQECFDYLGYGEGDCPVSETAAKETVALPVYPELGDDQAAYVVESIAAFFS